LFAIALLPAPALAHGEPASLSVWGGYPIGVARCQRAISFGALSCISRSIEARRLCYDAQATGGVCDEERLDASIQEARAAARSVVLSACNEQEAQNLRYIDVSEALVDVINVCRDADNAMTSAVYGPAMVAGSVASVDPPMTSCIEVTSKQSARVLRYAMRQRRQALDRIARRRLDLDAKQALLGRAERRIEHIRGVAAAQIAAECSGAEFQASYNRTIDTYLRDLAGQADCFGGAIYVQDAVLCPPPVCGNGVKEAGEACDDANAYEGDGCRSDCERANCEVFPTTFDLIQRAIFENHGCTSDICHGSAKEGGLDLRAGASYASLIDVPAQTVPGRTRVTPGDKDASLLWLNLAAATFPDLYHAPLRPMPLLLPPLSPDEIEALRLWIETGGATRDGTVSGTAELLSACLPAPRPNKIPPLPPPAPEDGVQLHMPAWTLPPGSESEVCFSSYYDLTGRIPAQHITADGKRFRYKELDIRQDPLSHHLIVDLFRGDVAPDDPIWGTYTCKGGAKDGQVCNPLNVGFCGEGDCATEPDPTTIACIGFGPQEGFNTLVTGGFAFAQETSAVFRSPPNVYDELPIKGTILWNSHAFNLTPASGTLEAWVNILFPEPGEAQFKEQQIFNVEKIFWTTDFPPFNAPVLRAFEKWEVCHVHTFAVPGDPSEFGGDDDDGGGFFGPVFSGNQRLMLFELSGHMHEHGKRFQIFRGAFTCNGGPKQGQPCAPLDPTYCPEAACVDPRGRDPQQNLLYTNFIYNDPVVLRFAEPMIFKAEDPIEDRALTYCAVYDNGAPPNEHLVKRRSTSAAPGTIFGFPIGGPCRVTRTSCIGGPQHGNLCYGDNAFCDTMPGSGDGQCDACPLTGGFRTTDEMFILFGNFWVE
jgi:cysteine-rich repeat protein